MKKLGIIDLAYSKKFVILSDWEKRLIIAGDGTPSWDCTFNAYVNYMGQEGYNINKDALIDSYCSYHGVSKQSIIDSGGVTYGSFSSFISSEFQMTMDQTTTENMTGQAFPNNYAIAADLDGSGIYHTVQPKEVQRITKIDGTSEIVVLVYDPTTNTEYRIPQSQVQGLLAFNENSLFGQPGYFGYDNGYTSYGYDGYGYDGYGY